MVSIADAKQILQLAIDAHINVFLDGGWGVDALVGYETRVHNDIDIFVEKNAYHRFIQLIKNNGFYEVKMEYTTMNHTVWEDAKKRIIDLHCFEYTDDGEILYDGDCFPAETFSGKGKIEEIEVTCIEPYSQVMFHLGYEFDENDVHDVKLLCETFHIDIPNEYR
ncbi:MAG: lincosamide nucleotidyltransferase Lnu(C) [Lachnospiraceae bacterium]|nr:lincosamide nucleotidyltransferase Lnu(C) [Lachnospiraceae bacterium]